MLFPIMSPGGALIASILLGVVLTLFALALRVIDRAVTRVADSVLSGLVSGFNGWSVARRVAISPTSPGAADREEPAAPLSVEWVRRT